MNIFDRLKASIDFFKYTNIPQTTNRKDFGDQWKKGLLLNSSPESVSLPYSQSAIVNMGVSKIADTLPQAPLLFYRGTTQLPDTDPLVKLFKRPNDRMTYFSFFETSTMYLALCGECFWILEESMGQRAGTSKLPSEIYVVNPMQIKEVVDSSTGKLLRWNYNNKMDLRLDEVIQVKFPNPYNVYRGLSPLTSVKSDIDSDFLAGIYTQKFFQNGAAPGIVFTSHQDDESTPQSKKSFLAEWNALHQGVHKSHKAAILNAGMDVKKIGSTQQEMDFNEMRLQLAKRILGALDVPPPVVGILDEATYSNIQTCKRLFWEDAIKSYTRRYEDIIQTFFLERFAPGITCMFDFSSIDELKRGHKEIAETVQVYAQLGVPVNTLVEAFNLPFDAVDGLDDGFISMNLIPVSEVYNHPSLNNGQMPVGQPPGTNGKIIDITPKRLIPDIRQIEYIQAEKEFEKGIRESHLRLRKEKEDLFHKTIKNYLYTQKNKVIDKLEASKSVKTGVDYSILLNKIDIWNTEDERLINKLKPIYMDIAQDSGDLARSVMGITTPFEVQPYIINQRINYMLGINNYTQKLIMGQLKKGIEAGEDMVALRNRVIETYDKFTTLSDGMDITRARKIARTEVGSVMNEVTHKEYKSNGVESKKWVGGRRETHAKVNGTVLPMNEYFSVGLSKLMYPGDPTGDAKEVINCTCCTIPVIKRGTNN